MPIDKNEWERCRPWIEAALKHGGGLYWIEDVEADLAAGTAKFWPGRNCAAVTNFVGKRTVHLNFWLLGGVPTAPGSGLLASVALRELVNEMRPAIEAWAAEKGFGRVMGVFGDGRRGWVRMLERHGYRPLWTALSKEL